MPTLTILHTNDIHARFDQMTRLATLIQRERALAAAGGRTVLLLDAGDSSSTDEWESDVTGGRANYAMLEAMGCDATTLGNSDSGWGHEALIRLTGAVHFPIVAANLRDAATNRIPPGVRAHALLTLAPAGSSDPAQDSRSDDPLQAKGKLPTVGVVGLTTHEELHIDFHAADPAETLRALIPQLQSEGAQIVIVLSHLGLAADRRLAATVPGIHAIVGGHTHAALWEPEHVGNTLITQSGEHGSFIGRLDLAYDTSTRAVAPIGYHLIPCSQHTPPDPTLAGVLELVRFEADVLRKKREAPS